MGILGPSKEEEDALRNAQSELNNNNKPYNHSIASSNNLSTVNTTDYESALENPESDLENDNDHDSTQQAITRTSSTATLQKNQTISSAETFEKPFNPNDEKNHSRNQSDSIDPIPIQQQDFTSKIPPQNSSQEKLNHITGSNSRRNSTISKKSRRSFTEGEYASPTRESRDLTKTEGEEYSEALQRTLSRKSLSHPHQPQQDEIIEDSNEIDPATLDWDGPDDKANPKNWPTWKRWAITMATAMICLEVSFGSSLYVAGVPDLMKQMHISQELGLSGLTFYLIGLAFGPALAAPASELFGRRIVYITSLPISMLFTMGVGLSKHIREVLVLRFFAGFFASPAMAVAGGTIADMWDFEMMGLAMAGFCLAPFMGPVLGPVIGGFVAENETWEWTMWVNLMFAGAILLPVLVCPETYKPVLLKKRAKKRGLKLQKPKISGLEFLKFIFFVTLMTPIKMLFVEPIVMVFSIYIAFVFAVLFGFFEAYPIIFRGTYKMSLGISGLAFLGVGVGLVLGTLFYVVLDRFKYFKKNPDGTRGKRDDQNRLILDAPESRLIICKVGAVALPPSLFWLGWSAKEDVHWICPIISGVLFGFGLILIFFTVVLYFSMAYPPLSLASALAANNLLRYVLASVFPLFTVQMYDKLGIDWASSLFAFIALAMVPVPWVFEKWGPALRQKSSYGYSAMIAKEKQENAKFEAEENKDQGVSSSDSEQNFNRV
ncbi:Polyamine transporter 2 [Wickerhamomyces ciferrii]|uniref:Polyamine transporter 2 n=1 Tax=Wickerhamomyces ciferrii (strain ATCC 14091 / BCRC 22168 / CBS 111 / JCM 3599 / NBRC 0793 / NRRL Y-1031 F-60-10) TaxID=1206466 RepID=K0KL92_WICCF|nr:Polyamine transporter 2 [Wickerhamomyces ciferrii]CCH42962.1 Polyamine transporter 2 [Wickerhamomyces ciferrii]